MGRKPKCACCDVCGCEFELSYSAYSSRLRRKIASGKPILCSEHGRKEYDKSMPQQEVECSNCGKVFTKTPSQIKRSDRHFCCRSCSATYNNTHKTKGTRRSKLEVWLEEQLTNQHTNLEILYCDKSTINSELDIYIPSLNLAFELNGIFHYEAIFGEDKLNQIQNNDGRKFQACLEKGIELCIIDTSAQTYVKESTSKKYLDIINQVISLKMK